MRERLPLDPEKQRSADFHLIAECLVVEAAYMWQMIDWCDAKRPKLERGEYCAICCMFCRGQLCARDLDEGNAKRSGIGAG